MFVIFNFLLVSLLPALVFGLCYGIGRVAHRRREGKRVGVGLAVGLLFVYAYGVTIGFRQFEVKHIELSSSRLPEAFNGFTIVQISDAHVGTLTGMNAQLLRTAVDSALAAKPDMIAFTGDLQNIRPEEIAPHAHELSRLTAPYGVFSVMGNHDYADYMRASDEVKRKSVAKTRRTERHLGWHLLENSHKVLRRGADSMVVAGMENDGEGPFPQLGKINKALEGVDDSAFVLMLEHDPTAWRRKILPDGRATLTLSGHTHAMQFMVGGWSPVAWKYKEWYGLYGDHAGHQLFVSKGLGGLLPFRLGAKAEIVVIKLKRE